MADIKCPRCGQGRTYRETRRVERRVVTLENYGEPDGHTWAGWWVCLDCWYKFDGVVDERGGVLPAGVVGRDD